MCIASPSLPPSLSLHTEVRCAESAKIRGKYQDRIPVSDHHQFVHILISIHVVMACVFSYHAELQCTCTCVESNLE